VGQRSPTTWLLKGIVSASTKRRIHVVTVATEHRAVLDPCRVLQDLGVRVTVVQPDQDGLISVEVIKRAITAETVLITVMTANNEIGVLHPISKIGALARSHGIVFHTDAAQALGKVPFVVEDLSVDLASFSAHKIYGPKGVGALYVRRRANVPLLPLIDGGGHEQGLRSGTLNVPGIVGFGCAASICQSDLIDERKRTQMLRDRLLSGLEYRLERIRVNGSLKHRLPNNLNVAFAGLEGESLLAGLNDVAVSSGAACTSANPEASHVLKAIGVPDILARASLRFGLGRWTTSEEIDYVVDKVSSLVTRLRELSSITDEDQVH
jgi:cysteine desulfurase